MPSVKRVIHFRILKTAATYFALVFSAGFVLGAIRTIWIVPLVGVRSAELLESPIMLVVTVLAARRVVRRKPEHPLVASIIALGFLLIAELSMVTIRHLSLREYFASRDPISGSVYLLLLALFAVMPAVMAQMKSGQGAEPGRLLDRFVPDPDVVERHEITVNASAGMVFEIARSFDMQSLWMVRAIFGLRAKLLGAKSDMRLRQGLVRDMLALGWAVLAESDKYIVMGAACQPWNADVKFWPIPPGEFVSFTRPDCVKIAWTIEAEPVGPMLTRLATETRVTATDGTARAEFLSYWRKFGVGIVVIRQVLLSAVRREAESRVKK